jgi:sensor c-di-GMP phosphodiesterase-like protein
LLSAIVGPAVVLTPVMFVAWRQVLSKHHDDVQNLAVRGLQRANDIYADAVRVLRLANDTRLELCSPAHIDAMRELTLQSLTVYTVAAVVDGIVTCNAYGMLPRPFPAMQTGEVQPDGVRMLPNWPGTTPSRAPILVLRLGSHSALVDQRQFFDGAMWSRPQQRLTLRTHAGTDIIPNYELSESRPPRRDGEVAVSEASPIWVATVTTPRIGFGAFLRSEIEILLPIAVVLGILSGGVALLLLHRRLSPKEELAAAVRNREFIVHYQPLIELATRRCLGAEALTRWRRPDGTFMRPDLFIPFAEDIGLIQRITDLAIESIVRDLGDLLRRDRSLHVSINVAAMDVTTGRIQQVLEDALRGANIEARQIWIELTERGFVNVESASATLAELQRRGHLIAIDDFGTGYSSLQYLERLPVDILKIDKSFIETVGKEAATSRVTGHIIAMARELNLSVVAEGVEAEAQAAFLCELEVQYAQGWLFAPALPPDQFVAYYRQHRRGVISREDIGAGAIC